VYAAGFSQGAMMTGSLLLTHAERFAGAMMFSGYLPDPATLTPQLDGLKGKPVFWGHGTGDAVLSIDFGRAGRDVLNGAGAALTYREYPMAHQISNKELADAAHWLTAQLDARLGETK
jgi:phospholipase/carboxylesterase